jgi:hypothetical protein
VRTSEQNGVAERENKHILEITRCLLFVVNVSKYLWREVAQTATYLINRISLRAMDFSKPIEMLTGTISFKVLRRSLGVCALCITQVRVSKFDVKSHKCVFVGYSSGKKGYKRYDPVKKKMLESLDVTFRDTEPYFVLSNAQSNTSPVKSMILLRRLSLFPRIGLAERGSIGYRTTIWKILWT